MSANDDLISQFTGMTGCSADRAKFYLESANWEIGPALETYFETEQNDEDVNMEEIPVSSLQQPRGMFGVTQQAAASMVPGMFSTAVPASRPAVAQAKKPNPASAGSARIATLASTRGGRDSDDDSDEHEHDKDDQQEFYVGSGQEVLGPKEKRNPEAMISSVFKAARQHGAEQVPPEDLSRQQQSGRPQMFGGAGNRLGATGSEPSSSAVAPPRGASENALNQSPSNVLVTIRMWRNGFTVNDEPVRLYADPANIAFMEQIKLGRVPRELVASAKGQELRVQMEDHRDKEYSAPKQPVQYFGGTGHMLGSPAPTLVVQTQLKKPTSVEDRAAAEDRAKSAVNVDPAQPTTNIQIRLADGSRLVHRFNETNTVGDVRRFIRVARPEWDMQDFQMLAGYPAKPLPNDAVSLKEANLLNAAITVK